MASAALAQINMGIDQASGLDFRFSCNHCTFADNHEPCTVLGQLRIAFRVSFFSSHYAVWFKDGILVRDDPAKVRPAIHRSIVHDNRIFNNSTLFNLYSRRQYRAYNCSCNRATR